MTRPLTEMMNPEGRLIRMPNVHAAIAKGGHDSPPAARFSPFVIPGIPEISHPRIDRSPKVNFANHCQTEVGRSPVASRHVHNSAFVCEDDDELKGGKLWA